MKQSYVKCKLTTTWMILYCRCKNEPLILSFSGSYGDDEAVLKWRRHDNEVRLVFRGLAAKLL